MKFLAVLLIALPLHAFAAEEDVGTDPWPDVHAQIEKEKLQRLKGWKRIVFLCSPPEKAKANAKEMFDRICERTNTNVKFLAAAAKLQVKIVPNGQALGFASAIRGRLRLEVDLFYVGCEATACAVHVDVSAIFPYDKAVDQAARSYPTDDEARRGPRDSPASIPRPINAVMWGPAHSTASGFTGEEMTSAMVSAIETILKEFFSDYLRANPD